ncbi:MAG: CotH kinase family protein, partial [Bacteroidales bacterium]
MRRFLLIECLIIILCKPASSQVFTDSNLPIVIINTDQGREIPDSPKVPGTMKIIYRGEGKRNLLTDQNNPSYLNYNGRMEIEIRGSSSQERPKKQYAFTTLEADNITEKNVSLLGMPKENDWILNGMIFDPALIRDYLSYNLSRQIGQYASRTVFCEVVINGAYKGL